MKQDGSSRSRLLFLSPPGIHVRFFRSLAAGMEGRGRVEKIRARLVPKACPDRSRAISGAELARVVAIHRDRRFRRNRRLLSSRLMRWIYDAILYRTSRWTYNHWLARFMRERDEWDAIVVWNGNRMPSAIIAAAARAAGMPQLYFELGAMPGTLQVDARGVNALNSLPRDPAWYLQREAVDFEGRDLVPRAPRRGKSADAVELPEHFLFAPFQVDADTQIVGFSPWIRSMRHWFSVLIDLQNWLREKGDPRVVVVREHPSDREDYSDLHAAAEAAGMVFANGNPMSELLQKADGVITINSSVGIEALLYSQKVIVCGDAFYQVDTLTQSARSEAELHDAVDGLGAFSPDESLRQAFLATLDEYFMPNFNVQAILAGDEGEHRRRRDDVLDRMDLLLQQDWPMH